MRPVLEQVHLHRHLGLPERQVEADAVLDRHAVVVGRVKNKSRRCLSGDLKFVRQIFNEFRIRDCLREDFCKDPACVTAGSNEITGYPRIRKSGRLPARSIGSAESGLPESKCVPAVEAR